MNGVTAMDFLVHHLLQTSARRFPAKEALVHGQERLAYAEAAKRTTALAYGLRCAGLRRGDRIGVYLDPSVLQALSLFAVSQAGGVFVPLNGLLFPAQVVHIARDCRMRGLLTSAAKFATLAASLKDIPSLEFLVVQHETDCSAVPSPLSVYMLEELVRDAPPHLWQDENIAKDLAAILYTSGSTGKPKGVMLSHEQIMAGSAIVSTYLDITANDRLLAVLPLSFDAGLNQLMTTWQQGGTLVMTTFVFAREIVRTLRQEQITGFTGVPTLWSLLAQPNSTLHKQQFPCLRYIANTGGAMPQNVLAVLRQALLTTKVFLMYGLTEAFRSTYLPPEQLDRRPTSIGKAIPNTEILVVNDQGQLCKPGEVGELLHRGPTVSMGYWGQPELTARILRPHPFLPPDLGGNERVCYSGDLVKMDEEGFLYFVGRRDNMIKSAGFRISPTEVEEVLSQGAPLRQAAVIGIPDEILGQSLKAFVVPQEGATCTPEALLAFCADKLPRYMVPKAIEIVTDLPKTPNGKIDYPQLRECAGRQ